MQASLTHWAPAVLHFWPYGQSIGELSEIRNRNISYRVHREKRKCKLAMHLCLFFLSFLSFFFFCFSPSDTWWLQGVCKQPILSRAVLPPLSQPLTLCVCLFFVLTRIVTKEVTQCTLECHPKVLALFIVQQVLSPFVQTRKAILSTGYCAQALMVPATSPYLSPFRSLCVTLASPARTWAQLPSFCLHCPVNSHIYYSQQKSIESGAK